MVVTMSGMKRVAMGWIITTGEAQASCKFCVAAVMHLFSMCCGDVVDVVCCAHIFLKKIL